VLKASLLNFWEKYHDKFIYVVRECVRECVCMSDRDVKRAQDRVLLPLLVHAALRIRFVLP
jgi:hypothetical protein